MEPACVTKHELRLELKKRTRCMSREARRRESKLILQQLAEWKPFQSANKIGVYLAMPDEVETKPILELAFELGKEVAVPVFDTTAQSYQFCALNPDTPIELGAFRVHEPVEQIPVDTKQLDLLLLPGRGFDRQCNRIGRGKGHIDALLASYPGIRAGLAFGWQLVQTIPLESHDEPLDPVVPSDEVIESGQRRL